MPGTGVRLGAGGGALPRRVGAAGVQGRHRRPEVSGLHHSYMDILTIFYDEWVVLYCIV